MKKILLCLFLLTSFPFYSQIADLASSCITYDLTRQNQLLIGNLVPNQPVITYHLSLAEATNGTNAIVNPEYYYNTVNATFIYARINNAGVISTNYFKLIHIYGPPPTISTSGYTSGLGKSDGSAELTIPFEVSELFVDVTNTTTGVHFPVFLYGNAPFQQKPIPNLNLGNYVCQIVDKNHCIYILNFTIADDPLNFTTTVIDKTITVNTFGGIPPYSYAIGNGNFNSNNVFSGLSVGTHTISVRDSNYQTLENKVTITEPGVLNATTTITNVSCYEGNNGSITVTATGGNPPYTYSKDGNNYVENNTFNNLVAKTYTTYVKDANGIVVSNVSTIVQPTTPLSISSFSSSLSCQNVRSITITATGGQAPYTYSKDGINYDSYNTFSDLDSGTYTMFAKDRNGCVTTKSIPLDQPAYFYIVPSVTNVSCNGNKDGSITLSVIGGSGTYKYYMTGDVLKSDNKYSGLAAGTYTITVTDSNLGCMAKASITITEPVALTVITTVANVSCHGDNTGLITIDATGGYPPYTYSKDGSEFFQSNTFNSLAAGTYTIYVKDANGCVTSNLATITQPIAPLSAVASTDNQTITITATGGSGGIKYAISPNLNVFSANYTFPNLAPGIYDVIAQDENGCFVITTNIINPSVPLINGNSIITQNFTQGQTLGDIVVQGENIKWYSNATSTSGKTKKSNETSLPLSTVLVNNTTYYASQTINGIESTERLAVTVKLGTLGTNDFVIKDFTYYPNPVKNIFTVSNTSVIDEVILISIKGETLLTQKINSLRSEIDLSNFSKGVYFLKVKSGEAEKTVKVIKE
jgi:hypothetical protein